jgi:Flp pilus assembly secretin CpaC
MVAGMITESDQRSLNGLPAFSTIPGFGYLTSQKSKQNEEDELLILITPYVVKSPERTDTPAIYLGKY